MRLPHLRYENLLQGPNEERAGNASARGYWVRPRTCSGVQLVTLCRFDHKLVPEPETGPFIPCERRLQNMEISEFKVVTFGLCF